MHQLSSILCFLNWNCACCAVLCYLSSWLADGLAGWLIIINWNTVQCDNLKNHNKTKQWNSISLHFNYNYQLENVNSENWFTTTLKIKWILNLICWKLPLSESWKWILKFQVINIKRPSLSWSEWRSRFRASAFWRIHKTQSFKFEDLF